MPMDIVCPLPCLSDGGEEGGGGSGEDEDEEEGGRMTRWEGRY